MYGGRGQSPGMGFGPAFTPPVVRNLLIANGVVFLLQMLVPAVNGLGAVIPAAVWQAGYLKESLELLHRLVPEAKTFAVLACDSVTARSKVKQIPDKIRGNTIALCCLPNSESRKICAPKELL